MNIVESPQINSFASVAEQANAQPEEPIFVLTSSQLQEIVSQAVQKAVQETTEPFYREIAYDRQRIAKLEQREPQPLQIDRSKILKGLLIANNNKMPLQEARRIMRLSGPLFSQLLAVMKGDIETRKFKAARGNQKLLVLKK